MANRFNWGVSGVDNGKRLSRGIWLIHTLFGALGIILGVLLFVLEISSNISVGLLTDMCSIMVVIAVAYQNIFYTVMSVLFCRSLSRDNKEYNKLVKI